MRKRSRQKRHLGRRRGTSLLRLEILELRRLLSLTHLYTFNDGTANDSVGGANGSLVHGATIVEGWLTLQNTSGTSSSALSTTVLSGNPLAQYAQLPAGVLPSSGSATVEVWYTSSTAMANGEQIFDFGNQNSGAGSGYLDFTPRSSSSDARGALRPPGGAEWVAVQTGGTFDGRSHMAAVVVDAAAGQLRLYIDGLLAQSTTTNGANLSIVGSSLAFLGRSLFDSAPAYTGAIDEVRIYSDAESAAAIATQYASGATRAAPTLPARQIENLDRGIVAFNRASNQVYMSWRLLVTDPSDVAFNVYRSTNGAAAVKRNSTPITKTTDFTDTSVTQGATNDYFVRAVINGVEQADSRHFTIAANTAVNQYLNIPLTPPVGGSFPDTGTSGGMIAYTYAANDVSVGDLDGDGQYELVLKWDPTDSKDNSQSGYTGDVYIDAYKLDGTRLWRIDLGKNIRAGAHYTQFQVYDLDGDGKAEVAMKTAPGTIDGLGHPVLMGSDSVNADYRNSSGYILTGPEYLTVFNGLTGANMSTIAFQPARGSVSQWGDTYGNRVDRFTATIAYLDGQRPSLVMGRGYYGPQSGSGQARNEIAAYDFRNGQLTLRWHFKAGKNINNNINSNYIGQGPHGIDVADLDGDGKDEIVYGAMALNDNGTGLYSTGLGHGDAFHLSDLDQSRAGEEFFMVHEDPGSYGAYGGELRNALTGQDYFAIDGHDADVGRGNAFDIDPRYPGAEMWTSSDGSLYNVSGLVVQAKPGNMFQNFGIQWDADMVYELLDGTTIGNWTITNGVGGRSNYVFAPSGLASNNGTKSTPSLAGDILGDWRDEVIWRTADSSALQIWSTVIPAASRMTTMMDDLQYRESIAWQNSAYNQPPNPSFYMGDGMRTPLTPNVYFAGGPNNITLTASVVAENLAAGTTVGNFATTTLGTSNTYTYSFVTGTGSVDNSSFQIVGGQLKTNASFDYESKSSYSVRIRTTDGHGLFYDRQMTILVGNVNEAPTAVSLTNAIALLPELTNTSTHIKIADIVVTDDALGSETLGLAGADAGSFEIVGSSLYLKAGTVLNYDVKSAYLVTVTADDPTVGATPDVTVAMTLNLNDAPKVATPATATPNPLTGATASLSVLGSDDGGDRSLLYTWTTVGVPPAPVVFGDNGSLAARNTTATFSRAGTYQLQVAISDGAGQTIVSSTTVTVYSSIAGRDVFYGGSAFDAGGHDGAIAPDKTALLPGQTASFANYTSFSRGLNGVIVDIAMPAGDLTTADFAFRVGNDDAPAAWAVAPVPVSVVNRAGAGVGGSTRVEINWADNAMQNLWIEVTVKGGGHTGLSGNDVFYFGNTPGEVGHDSGSARVDAIDQLNIRYGATGVAGIGSVNDVNRDGRVDGADENVARGNTTYFLNELRLITVPGGASAGLAGLGAARPAGIFAAVAPSALGMDAVEDSGVLASGDAVPAAVIGAGPIAEKTVAHKAAGKNVVVALRRTPAVHVLAAPHAQNVVLAWLHSAGAPFSGGILGTQWTFGRESGISAVLPLKEFGGDEDLHDAGSGTV